LPDFLRVCAGASQVPAHFIGFAGVCDFLPQITVLYRLTGSGFPEAPLPGI
jgi:hypothetical protein